MWMIRIAKEGAGNYWISGHSTPLQQTVCAVINKLVTTYLNAKLI